MNELNKTLGNEFHQAGYDREEEYFYRQNRELIEKNRRALDERRHARADADGDKAFWQRCPSCGGSMQPETMLGLTGEVCSGCGGVFFDRDELANLSATHEAHSFKEAMHRFLAEATRPRPSGIGQFPV